jgi:hypothetical protein
MIGDKDGEALLAPYGLFNGTVVQLATRVEAQDDNEEFPAIRGKT